MANRDTPSPPLGVGLPWGQAQDVPALAVNHKSPQDKIELVGELESKQSISIYAPEIPSLKKLVVASVVPEGSLVEKGQVLVVFDQSKVVRKLKRAETHLVLASAKMKKIEMQFAAERTELALEVKRQEFEVERAKLMAVSGVGIVPAIQAEKARLNCQSAELSLNRCKQNLKVFDLKFESAMKVEKLRIEARN